MDFNADDAYQYVAVADYPAGKEELIERLGSLSTPEYSNLDEVVRELATRLAHFGMKGSG